MSARRCAPLSVTRVPPASGPAERAGGGDRGRAIVGADDDARRVDTAERDGERRDEAGAAELERGAALDRAEVRRDGIDARAADEAPGARERRAPDVRRDDD